MRWPKFILIVVVLLIAVNLAGSGMGTLEDWMELKGTVPGTGGVIAKGHLVVVLLILVIASVLSKMPRHGGPATAEPEPDEESDSEPDALDDEPAAP